MTNVDSQRIREIRDNTKVMAEAFSSIADTLAEALELYVSTQTACALGNYSLAIYSLYNDTKRASTSLRISISYLTTYEEIDKFIDSLTRNMKALGE